MRPANIEIDLLASLHGPSTQRRLEDIGEAAPGTYQWVFDRTRVPFPDWLQESEKGNDTIFWIRGKAGSGKSTLMKYLLTDHRTLELLQGATSFPWILIGLFFSNRAVEMTINNVLRHMLYQIIVQNPHMRGIVGRVYLACEKQGTPQWDSFAIKDALKAILRQRESSCQIALFVDGLDELSSDDIDQLLDVIGQLGAFPDGQIVKLKVCIASRPWPGIQDRLKSFRGFLLNDYTITDIQKFINDSLSATPISISRPQIQALADTITAKANGVFLWVALVLRSVLTGLNNGDNLSDLEKRVAYIPSGMFDLYMQVLKRVDPFYAPQTYMMLQVALCALRPLSLEAFSSCIFDVPALLNDPERFIAQEQTLIRRINARCGGMLEVTPSLSLDEQFDDQVGRSFSGRRSYTLRVLFIHPSVRDFFRHNHDELFSLVNPSQRQSGYLLLLQAGMKSEHQRAHELTRDIFTYAHRIEKEVPQEADDAAKILDSLLHTGRPLQDDHRLKWCLPPAQIPCWLDLLDSLKDRNELKLLCLAVAANLKSYVNKRLSPVLLEDRAVELMLPLAILGPKIVPENTDRTEMVKLLLEIGVPVNPFPLRSLIVSFIPGRTKDNDRSIDLPTNSTLALILGDTENQWGMKESDRSALISLLLRRGAPANFMVYRFKKGMHEFREGLPALHHCVVQESPELVELFLQHSTPHNDWPVSPAVYAIMRQDPAIERTLAKAGYERGYRSTKEARADTKGVLVAMSLIHTALHPDWAVPNPRKFLLATLVRLRRDVVRAT